MGSCSEPPPYRGSVRDLVPAQVGNFKLKGELKPAAIGPPEQYKSGALRPTEGVVASYEGSESSASSPLTLQVTNYSSVADAGRVVKQTMENVVSLANGAKIEESPRKGSASDRRLAVEGISPGYHAVIWTRESVVYQVTGDNLNKVQEFEKSFP